MRAGDYAEPTNRAPMRVTKVARMQTKLSCSCIVVGASYLKLQRKRLENA